MFTSYFRREFISHSASPNPLQHDGKNVIST